MQIIAEKENEKEILEDENIELEEIILSIKEKLEDYE
jgi:hypothetical protein